MESPVYLYIKKHNITGLLYFGRTVNPDPDKYPGSGVHWSNHLKKHGKNISTIYFEKFKDQYDAKEFAVFLSEEFDIVKSNKWANLIIEDGSHRGSNKGIPLSTETKMKLRIINTGKKSSIETKHKISEGAKIGAVNRKSPTFTYFSCIYCKERMATSKLERHQPNSHYCLSKQKYKFVGPMLNRKNKIQISQCIHCKASGANFMMSRYHNNNCKNKL